MDEPRYPGAVPPERRAAVESAGIRLNLLEWGNREAPPLVLCHGMFDHAMGFATLAPLLARLYRVIGIDARGHGDSEWADAYTWPTDVLDIVNVLRWVGRPSILVGHSKGGGQAVDAAVAAPEMVVKVVNIDGFGPPPFRDDQIPKPAGLATYLDRRRGAASVSSWRTYPSFEDLVQRRGGLNPRLRGDWLPFFVYHGARTTDDGWRWKSDPHMANTFGPWDPNWIAPGYRALTAPILAISGSEQDTWGPLPEALLSERLANFAKCERATIKGAGHFVHMEKPTETADCIVGFLES